MPSLAPGEGGPQMRNEPGGLAAVVPAGRLLLLALLALARLPGAAAHREFVQTERTHLEEVLRRVQTPPEGLRPSGGGRGIVIVGGRHNQAGSPQHWAAKAQQKRRGVYYTLDALLAVASLRRCGCGLPVEVWHDGDPALLEAPRIQVDSTVGKVMFRDFRPIMPDGQVLTEYSLSSLVLMYSTFEEVLYLDADMVAVADPTPLFDEPEYLSTGAVFWSVSTPYEPTSHVLWKILRSRPMPHKVDNAVMLLHRGRHLAEIEVTYSLSQRWSPLFFDWPLFLNGDADMFAYAFLATSKPFHLVVPPAGLIGFESDGVWCGHSISMRHPNRTSEMVFVHRARNKFSYLPQADLPATSIKHTGARSFQSDVRRSIGATDEWCIDFFSSLDGKTAMVEVDNSAAVELTLQRLASLDKELIGLRGLLLEGSVPAGASSHGLAANWWAPLLTYLLG